MRRFWDAAVELDPDARELDEGVRFPLCAPDRLAAAWINAGLSNVLVMAIDVPDALRPTSTTSGRRSRSTSRQRPGTRAACRPNAARRCGSGCARPSPTGPEGTIDLIARAWAIRGQA